MEGLQRCIVLSCMLYGSYYIGGSRASFSAFRVWGLALRLRCLGKETCSAMPRKGNSNLAFLQLQKQQLLPMFPARVWFYEKFSWGLRETSGVAINTASALGHP